MTDESDAISEGELDAARGDREGAEWLSELQSSPLETVQPGGAGSRTPISATAFDLIVEFEVSSEATYRRKYLGAIWPGGASGVTVGIGYDVGYATIAMLRGDFGGRISAGMLDALGRTIGKTGAAARALAQGLTGQIDIPWDVAISVHRDKVLPRWVGLVEHFLPNTGALGPDSLGALVSLTYNRGASYTKAGERYAEMRAIRTHMAARAFGQIPGEIRAMKRLWPTVPGLQKRREREARMFEAGLGLA